MKNEIAPVRLVNANEVINEINQHLSTKLEELTKVNLVKENDELITRRKLKDMLEVNYSTINAWCKQDRLKPYGLGGRVYFKRSEVEASLTPLNKQR